MVQRNASDLLLKVGRPPTVRLNGELTGLDMPPLKPIATTLFCEISIVVCIRQPMPTTAIGSERARSAMASLASSSRTKRGLRVSAVPVAHGTCRRSRSNTHTGVLSRA